MNAQRNPTRFMLWIDGVGGYLVCERDTVVVGQPTTIGPSLLSRGARREDGPARDEVDIAVMADVSRRHAEVARDGEHYWLRPLRNCRVGGRAVKSSLRLDHGTCWELGEASAQCVRFRFAFPRSCGLTARLDLESGHRLHPHADAVVLLADHCLLGSRDGDHIRLPGRRQSLVVGRRPDGGLVFRAEGSYDVDGRRLSGTTPIARTARIRGEDFSLKLEPA